MIFIFCVQAMVCLTKIIYKSYTLYMQVYASNSLYVFVPFFKTLVYINNFADYTWIIILLSRNGAFIGASWIGARSAAVRVCV